METITFNNHNKRENKVIKRKLFSLGLVFIILAAVFTINKTDLIPELIKVNMFKWQGIMVIIGILGFVFNPFRIFPFLLAANGVFFFYLEYYQNELSIDDMAIPALLASLGLLFIFKIFERKRCHTDHHFKTEKVEADYYERNLTFSGVDNELISSNFKGGIINCVFGGAQIDLRNVKLSEGENVLKLDCVFGGVKIIANSDIEIITTTNSIFGGFADKRENINYAENAPKLHIKGKFVFGGGVVENTKN